MGYERAAEVPPEWFKFVPHNAEAPHVDAYYLDGRAVYGHYNPSRAEIHYCVGVERVVRHEAGHAILHRLHEDTWRCYQHPCWEGDGQ